MLSRSELLLDPDKNPNPIPLHFRPHHIHHTHSAKLLPTAANTKVNCKIRTRTGHEVSVDININLLVL
jgi:integrase